MTKYMYIMFILIIFLFTLMNCPSPDKPEDGDPTPQPTAVPVPGVPLIFYTFEDNTGIANWLGQGAVYVQGENGATGSSCDVSTEQAEGGVQSLKIMGTLGTDSYSSHEARVKLYETQGLAAQDFSQAVIAVSVYVPPEPVGGGNYIQVVLHNSDYDNVQSKGFPVTYSTWNLIVFDIGAYVDGTETWGYDTTNGNPEVVYTAVIEVGVKVGFTTGPNRSYYYYIDNLNIGPGSLRTLATANGIYIGAAVNPDHFSENGYNTTLKNEFNMLVAENVMKMNALQPVEGNFNFIDGDEIIDFAELNDMEVRGHTLLWHNQVPDWIKQKNYSELGGVLQSHIDNVATHYNGKIHSWDVVNEVIKDDGTGLRNNDEDPEGYYYSIWADSPTDDSLIKQAFYWAAAADPDALLFINDYSNETMGQTKADALYSLIAGWVGEEVPIDGVGFQLHVVESYTPDYTNIRANIDRYISLGLEIQFTEIDVRIEEPVTQAKLENQASIYANLMQIVYDYPGVTCFVTWGVSDKYSWIPTFFPGYNAALIFNEDYIPKPAYYTLFDVLD